jgi:uncharacterized protein
MSDRPRRPSGGDPPNPPGGKFFMGAPEGSEEFFEAAKDGKLLIQRCSACGEHQFYPRKVCVHCGSSAVEWAEASGKGTVHTYTVIHQQGMPVWRDQVPYVAAIIDLEEGVRMTSNVVDVEPSAVSIGMGVEVTFVDEGMYVLPRFRPAGS